MPDESSDTLTIVDIAATPAADPMGRPISTRGWLSDTMMRTAEHRVEELKKTMTKFLRGIQTILGESAAALGDFQIDTVEVNAQITGEGKICLVGSGLDLKGTTGLKIILKREKDH